MLKQAFDHIVAPLDEYHVCALRNAALCGILTFVFVVVGVKQLMLFTMYMFTIAVVCVSAWLCTLSANLRNQVVERIRDVAKAFWHNCVEESLDSTDFDRSETDEEKSELKITETSTCNRNSMERSSANTNDVGSEEDRLQKIDVLSKEFSKIFQPEAVSVILLTVLYVVGSILRRSDQSQDEETDATIDLRGSGKPLLPPPQTEQVHSFQSSVPPKLTPHHEVLHDPHVNIQRYGRPSTPVHANHYRPPTPQNQRPATPVNSQQRPAVDDFDREKSFREFSELTEVERADIVDLNQCSVDIERSRIDPLLEQIRRKGEGQAVEYVYVYFSKTSDKQLTASEKAVRKSFKIKDQRTNNCRFARMKVAHADQNYYRLVFKDYSPYIEEHVPRFDVFKQEISNDRSHWEEVEVKLFQNSQPINANRMSVLVPGKKD